MNPRFNLSGAGLIRPLHSAMFFLLLAGAAMFTAIPAHAADTFIATGGMSMARRAHTATRLPDARVLVAGGLNETGTLGGAELYNAASGAWTATAAMGTARSGATAVLLQNGKVLINGGRDGLGNALASAELYDPATGTWAFTGAMTTARRHHTATLLQNGKVLVAGGALDDAATVSLDTSELYDPATGTWTETGLLNYARSLHTVSLAGGQAFAIGGTSGSSFITVIELYNPDWGTWNIMGTGPGTSDRARKFHTATLLPNSNVLVAGGTRDVPLATARLLIGYGLETTGSLTGGRTEHTAAVLSGNRVLAAGGLNAAGVPTAGAEIYQESTKTWSAAASLITARAGHTATVLAGGAILLAGGYDPAGSLSSCEIYSAQPTQWTETGPMTGGRSHHTSTLLPDGKVLVTGGFGWGQSIVGSAEVYNPAGDAWSPAGPFSPRTGHSATLLEDGRVVVTGGYTDTQATNYTAATTLYDSATGTWSQANPLQTARAFHAAVLLPAGKVLVAGGYRPPNNTALASVELFDPVSGSWSPAASMLTERQTLSATLLSNGKVLVMSESPPTEPGSAELYDPVNNVWQAAASPLFPHVSPALTLLPDGRVLVTGGADYYTSSSTGKAEIYNPLTNTWAAAAPMRTEGVFHSATLLQDGRVLVSGNYFYPMNGSAGRAEIYDPAADSWVLLGNVKTRGHGVSLLLDGRALFTGGEIFGNDPATVKTQTFNAFFAATGTARPVIASASFDGSKRLNLSGSGFTGSPETEPVVKLRRLDNGQTATLPSDPSVAWSGMAFTSLPATGFPPGPAMATVYLNGVPGQSIFVNVPGPEISVQRGTSGSELVSGSQVDFGTVTPGGSGEITFVIKNTGGIDLTGLAVTIDGADASFFTLVTAPAVSLSGPAGSTPFTVSFASGSPGVKNAVLHLANNDADESSFSLLLKGTGTNTAPLIASLENQTTDEDTATAALALTLGDMETPGALTLSALSSNQNLITPARIVFGGGAGTDRNVTLTPLPNASGQALITLIVSDGLLSATTTFTLTVNPVDDPPAMSPVFGASPILEDAAMQTVQLSGITSGIGENQPLTVTAVSTNPDVIPHPQVTYAGGTFGSIRFAPAPNASGSAMLRVSVSEGPAAEDTITRFFTVIVTAVNDPPTLAVIPAPAAIPEDSGMQTLTLSGISPGPGEEGQTVTITAVSGNPSLIPNPQVDYTSPAATAGLSYTPVADASGTALITVTARDAQATNGTVIRTFTVTVLPVNDLPTLNIIPDPAPLQNNAGVQTVAFGGISAGVGETDGLTVSAVSSNPALIPQPVVTYTSGAAGGTLQFTPAAGQSGSALITVTVNDGNSTASQSFTVRVQPLLHGEAASVVEGNAGEVFLDFRLFLDAPQLQAVNVKYMVEAGSAQAGSDFTAASGTAVIAAGETVVFVRVNVAGDTEFEAHETLTLVLTNPEGALLGTATSLTGTITNDDAQPALSLTAGSVTESSAPGPYRVWVNATLASPSLLPLTWTLTTRAGTAEAGSDFTPLGPVSLTFAPGETSKWVTVAVTGNQGSGEGG